MPVLYYYPIFVVLRLFRDYLENFYWKDLLNLSNKSYVQLFHFKQGLTLSFLYLSIFQLAILMKTQLVMFQVVHTLCCQRGKWEWFKSSFFQCMYFNEITFGIQRLFPLTRIGFNISDLTWKIAWTGLTAVWTLTEVCLYHKIHVKTVQQNRSKMEICQKKKVKWPVGENENSLSVFDSLLSPLSAKEDGPAT